MDGTKTLNECFIEACEEDNLEKVNASILLGCDVNYEYEDQEIGLNYTGLMLSALYERTEVIKRLGRVPGLNVNKENRSGDTAVSIAVKHSSVDCLKALALIPGANLNIPNLAGDAPIIVALKKNKMDAFKFLVEKLGNLQIKDEHGYNRTLEQVARALNRTEYLKLIPGTAENKVEILSRKVESLEMERTREVPECPVCLSPVHPPTRIFQCFAGHIVCGDCESRIMVCPTCREPMIGRAHAFEQFLRGDQ